MDLCGSLNRGLTTRQQLRFGEKGSISVERDGSGQWYDFEKKTGGGTLALVMHKTDCRTPGEAAAWIKTKVLKMKDVKTSTETVDDDETFDFTEYYYHDEYGKLQYRVRRRRADRKLQHSRWDAETEKWVTEKACMKGVKRLPISTAQVVGSFREISRRSGIYLRR